MKSLKSLIDNQISLLLPKTIHLNVLSAEFYMNLDPNGIF